MTTLQERYAEALFPLLQREGPISDLTPVLERLDVLTGLELAPKQLNAGVPPEMKAVLLEIEHGAGAPESDDSLVAETPAPVVHEEPQQAPVSVSAGATVSHVAPPPAAPSPDATRETTKFAGATRVAQRCIDCQKVIAPQATRCRNCSGLARRKGPRDAATPRPVTPFNKGSLHSPPVATGTPRPAPQEPLTPPVPPETPAQPTRGLSNVVALPAVEPPPQCKCAGYRGHVDGFRQDIANEAHAKTCPMYRAGGHKWPLPRQDQDAEPPYEVTCTWCGQGRDVDRSGVEWSKSERNPAVTLTSPFAKNVRVPA